MSTSIEQNISLGSVRADLETVLWAGDLARVSEFANRHQMDINWNSKKEEESLSRGQRQAISLRALVKKPSLILDEPTSSMDARSEQTFVQKFKEEKLDCTLLVITHRTSLLSLVDRVIIMEYGKVAGMGTTEQFMKAQTDRAAATQIVKNATAAQFGMGPAPDKDADGKIRHFQKQDQ